MDRKIRVGAVSYLNTKPLVYGLEKGLMKDEIELIYDYPSKIASMLVKNEIDVGLVPVAIIPRLSHHQIITEYCIGADGPVASVCLFSDVPIEQVKEVLLDYQSRTSVALVQILLNEFWQLQPDYIDASERFISQIKGTTAGLVIGDRAFQQRKKSRFIYDLGKAWKEFTGLPFVFASWITTRKLSDDFIKSFNSANAFGFQNLDKVIRENYSPLFDLKEYYTKCISYHLDAKKKEGLRLFLSKLEST